LKVSSIKHDTPIGDEMVFTKEEAAIVRAEDAVEGKLGFERIKKYGYDKEPIVAMKIGVITYKVVAMSFGGHNYRVDLKAQRIWVQVGNQWEIMLVNYEEFMDEHALRGAAPATPESIAAEEAAIKAAELRALPS